MKAGCRKGIDMSRGFVWWDMLGNGHYCTTLQLITTSPEYNIKYRVAMSHQKFY